jgi:hypothetical protein
VVLAVGVIVAVVVVCHVPPLSKLYEAALTPTAVNVAAAPLHIVAVLAVNEVVVGNASTAIVAVLLSLDVHPALERTFNV